MAHVTGDAAPLLAGYEAHSTVTWLDGKPMAAQAFCGTARAVSAALPRGGHAVNLCECPSAFLLGSAAAWIAGQALVLPSDRLALTLDRLRRDFPEAYCLCDASAVAELARSCGFEVFMIEGLPSAVVDWPPPQIPLSQVVAYLHTSGSTGEPGRHEKSWGELVGGTATLLDAFGLPGPSAAILGTVAPQHMFGFETTVMLPLRSGAPLLPFQPVLPGDLAGALRSARAGS